MHYQLIALSFLFKESKFIQVYMQLIMMQLLLIEDYFFQQNYYLNND